MKFTKKIEKLHFEIFPENYQFINNKIIESMLSDIIEGRKLKYIFFGSVGVGKSYLAQLIIDYLKKTGLKCKESTARNLYQDYLRVLKGEYSDKTEALTNKQRFLRGNDKIVYLDDLGTEPKTEASKEFIQSIFEDRYFWESKGNDSHLIITTNFSAGDKIKKFYGDRVLDRIYEMFTVCKFKNTNSFRTNKLRVIDEN